MRKIDTILFDLDGTLIDSNALILKCFEETMNKYMPQKSFSHSELLDMVGPPLKETFKIATEDPLVIEEMISYYRSIYLASEFDYIDVYPHVIETLKTLHDRGFNLGIVTTKFKSSAMPSIEHYGLDQFISSYCFLNDIKEHKPHPEPIFYALKQFDNYNEVIMVGDNASDILAGRNAATKTCGVDWSIKRDSIKELKPDFWIYNYMELITIIDEYNKEA